MAAAAVMMLAAAAAPALAQGQPEFRGETTVTVVEVPVRVTDPATGEPVRGLNQADFTLLEDGERQEITNFAEIGGVAAAAAGTAGPVLEPGAGEARRLELVYFFDLFLMQKRERDVAVEGVRQQYRGQLPSHLQVSIVSFDGTLRCHLDRSGDQIAVQAALDEVAQLETRGSSQMVSFGSSLSDAPASDERDPGFYERRQRSREFVFELERRVKRVGQALGATLARFAPAEGRRVLVVFTPGQPITQWSPTYYPVDFRNAEARYPAGGLWQQVAMASADLGFTLYIVDTSGLRAGALADVSKGVTSELTTSLDTSEYVGTGDTVNREGADPVQNSQLTTVDSEAGIANLGSWLERARKDLLIDTAELTGGQARFDNDPARALAAVTGDLDHYYSLGFTNSHTGDGKEHKIEVRVPSLPNARLAHRTEYLDRLSSERQSENMRSQMLFTSTANPLGIRVEPGEPDGSFRLGAAGSKRVKLPLAVKIPFAHLELVPRGDVYWGKILVSFFAEDGTGNQSPVSSYEQPLTVPTQRLSEAISRGYFTYHITVELEGADQELYVGVKDLVGETVSVVTSKFSF